MENNVNGIVADLLVKGDKVIPGSLSFVSAEYTEAINGPLPRLVARFLCDANKIPLGAKDVDLTLKIYNSSWDLKANVDDMKFEIHTVTIFFTLAPKDFYYTTNSSKFSSFSEVIEKLYYGKDIEGADLLDDRRVELNQVGVSDHRFLNIALKSLKSPSVFSYNLNSLRLNSLNSTDFKVIDPREHAYDVYDTVKNYVMQDLLEAPANYNPIFSKNGGTTDMELLEWGGIKVQYAKEVSDGIQNLVDNTIYQKQLKLNLRIVTQFNANLNSGDLVTISIPNLDTNKFLVMDKLIIIGSEIKFSYGLKSLEK